MKNLIQQRQKLLADIGLCADVVRGTVNSVCARCSRAGCICTKKATGKAYRLTYKDRRQKTRIVYVAQSRLTRIRRMIADYARLRELIERLVDTNIAIFKEEARH